MKKIKGTKATKTKSRKSVKKATGTAPHATEHDFIIIAGGGLVVLMLTIFLFLQ